MVKTIISERIMIIIAFLSGVIFSNAIVAIVEGQYAMGLLMLATVVIALLMKRFIDWDLD